MSCRLGEAKNPGPIIGIVNPTGLNGRASTFATLPAEPHSTIWGISETHLTKPGQSKFAKESILQKTGYRLQMGTPVPPRSQTVSAVAGKHRGVGFVTNAPTRALTTAWDPDFQAQNRVHASSFQLGHRSIAGGVVYGFAVNPDTQQTKTQTQELCQALTDRLVYQQRGLRFIGGDFNQGIDGLPCMHEWEEAGWVNVQKWAHQQLGKDIQYTCKGVSTKDHLFLSPELAMYLKDVHVDDTFFPDHAILWAELHPLGNPPQIPLWKQPLALPWNRIPALHDEGFQLDHSLTPDLQYQQLCTEMERRVQIAMQTQGKPLPRSSFGRACTREVLRVQEYTAQARKARDSEPQPQFHGCNLRHAQRLRQLRRLVNLQRMLKNQQASASQRVHAHGLWKSILGSPGFDGGFRKWSAEHMDVLVPPASLLPTQPEVEQLAAIFEQTFRSWETELVRTRVAQAKKRRQDHPHVIFQDLKADSSAPVQMLVDTRLSRVTSVDASEHAIEVHPPQQWSAEEPVQIQDTLHDPIHSEPDKLWLEDIQSIQAGDRITQNQIIGDLPALFHAFGQEWSKRWDKHAGVPEEAWHTVIRFVDEMLPATPPMEYTEITLARWKHSLRRKPAKAATGPDSMSRADLLNLPDDLTNQLLQILQQAELTGHWPIQLVEGFVVALEKQADAAHVSQFRPITVFPVAYRNWSSIRAREILKHLEPFAPATCTGSLPGRSASHIWYGIMDSIEWAPFTHSSLSGGVIDLVKAYNTLPRLPVMHIMKRLGVAEPVLRGWSGALCLMQRRFRLRNATGPPLRSTTGYAEGCALSCAAMLGLNLFCHRWCTLQFPRLTLWSYVDNIEVTGPDAPSVREGMEGLAEFCALLDLQIDDKKCYTWSVEGASRKELREHFSTKLHARDLGGHVQYSRQVTNATLTQKMDAMPPLWNKLSRSQAPYHTKVRAVKAKAWPASLHAIAAVHLGEDHFMTLRTGVMRGLGEHSSGTSPAVHLSLVENPLLDPQCYAILETVLTFRVLQQSPANFAQMLQELHAPTKVYVPRPGLASVMLSRLHQIGWFWLQETVFADHAGLPCDVYRCSLQELRQRIIFSWQTRVQTTAAERKTMKGLQRACPLLTVNKMHSLPAEDQAILRTCLNGTFFTADRLKHRKGQQQVTEDFQACAFCGLQDSQYHRHWECEAFQSCRRVSQVQMHQLQNMPPCVTCHGWMLEPPSLQRFRELCFQVPDTREVFHLPLHMPDHLHLFTDGGSKAPSCPLSRWGAWGVVLGHVMAEGFFPVASGLLHGWLQTPLRGEITAAISACCFAILTQRPCTIWTDNQLVFDRLNMFRARPCWFKPNQTNRDLWQELYALVRALGPLLSDVIKVRSHVDLSHADDEFEFWAFQGNAAVDALVSREFQQHSAHFYVWTKLRQDIQEILSLRHAVHATLLEVGKCAVRKQVSKNTQQDAPPHVPRIRQEEVHVTEIRQGSLDLLTDRYKFPGCDRIFAWLFQLTDPQAAIRLVSWFQIAAVFEMHANTPGVR